MQMHLYSNDKMCFQFGNIYNYILPQAHKAGFTIKVSNDKMCIKNCAK